MIPRQRRLDALTRQVRRLERKLAFLNEQSRRLSVIRLFLFLGGLGLGVVFYYWMAQNIGWGVIAATVILFGFIAFYHSRLNKGIDDFNLWRELKLNQIDRMQLNWDKLPESKAAEVSPDHPFARDLDIVGRHSLIQIVDTAVSTEGSKRLRAWLLEINPNLDDILHRQKIVTELTPLSRFREKLQLTFKRISKTQLESRELLSFLEKQLPDKKIRRVFLISLILAIMNLLLFPLSQFDILPPVWIAGLIIYGIVYFMNAPLLESMLDDVVLMSEELRKFRTILLFLEKYPYGRHRTLRRQCEPFLNPGRSPSRRLRSLVRLAAAIGFRMNPAMRVVLNVPLPWDFFFAVRLNRAKTGLAEVFPQWLESLHEMEALSSLANFGYLNPDYVFPKIISPDEKPDAAILSTESLGHPLIRAAARICNDFEIPADGEIALITGSNMSGKSTFLKTVGMNLALAFTGAPVVARRLQTRIMTPFTCINISDSVTEGFSFFYAEVRRLKELLLRIEQSGPVFFLIDEIFKGTNNRERLLGSQAYVETLAELKAVGLISTHDLELTHLSEKIPTVKNYHFREEITNGKMSFDYKIHPGPCPTTNALKIMKIEGLPVSGK